MAILNDWNKTKDLVGRKVKEVKYLTGKGDLQSDHIGMIKFEDDTEIWFHVNEEKRLKEEDPAEYERQTKE